MSEDFSVATAADGDNSSRSLKALATLKDKIKPAKSAWSCYQTWYFTQPDATREGCASTWKALAELEREKFKKEAAEDRIRYEEECAARDAEALKEQEENRRKNSASGPTEARSRPKYVKKGFSEERKASMAAAAKARRERLEALEMRIADESDDFTIDSVESEADKKALQTRAQLAETRVRKNRFQEQVLEHARIAKAKRAQRLKFLLKQSDIFSHFIDADAGAPLQQAQPSDVSESAHTLSSDSLNSPTKRKRKTEKEEDEALLEAEMAAQPSGIVRISKQPSNIKFGKMRPYQIESLNWMAVLYRNGMNGILADEMGLGKTLQSIAILAYLAETFGINGPHIVVVPKSTLQNWMNEYARWCPSLRTLRFHGNKDERKRMIEENLIYGQRPEDRTWDVLVTTYEMCIRCESHLKKFPWQYLVLDEAHRVKNEGSRLARVLRGMHVNYRLLLTGTPLQNNLHELWALLNFLLPEIFHSSEKFDEWFNLSDNDDNDSKQNLVRQLHKILKPFMLRRLKADVERDLLPKVEVLLYTGFSDIQRELYKKTLMREMAVLQSNATKSSKSGAKSKAGKAKLCNIVMQLRKVCNHPYLFDGVEDRSLPPDGEHLIENCGKLRLLDKLLARLKQGGHRVLIFSQMTRLLDILEDYCFIRKHDYCRLDGQTPHDLRTEYIDAFNAKDSSKFIFLLSTRAGGLGINLQTADTVILFDSDWNPQVDLQAQDRAHRIGQKKQVHIYRLVTQDTIEEKILERAELKLRLDAVVIQQGRAQQNNSVSADQMLSAIRYGADKVFRGDGATITDEDIDALIGRGKEKAANMKKVLEEKAQGDVLDFKLEYSSSLQEFEGVDFSEERKRQEEKKKQEALKFALSMSDAVGKRQRSQNSYNEDAYFRDALATGPGKRVGLKKAVPRPREIPKYRPWQFFNNERLRELYVMENAAYVDRVKAFKEYKYDPPDDLESRYIFLDEEHQAEKERLLAEGFPNWTRQDYKSLVKASARHGIDQYDLIAQEMESMEDDLKMNPVSTHVGFGNSKDSGFRLGGPEDIKRYAEVFWDRGREIIGGKSGKEWNKYLRLIERGAKQRKSRAKQMDSIKRIVTEAKNFNGKGTYDPYEGLNLIYTGINLRENEKWTEEEDAFLLCEIVKQGKFGLFGQIRRKIMLNPRFAFDYFFRTRTAEELEKRCKFLLRVAQKHEVEQKKRKAKVSAFKAKRKAKAEAEMMKYRKIEMRKAQKRTEKEEKVKLLKIRKRKREEDIEKRRRERDMKYKRRRLREAKKFERKHRKKLPEGWEVLEDETLNRTYVEPVTGTVFNSYIAIERHLGYELEKEDVSSSESSDDSSSDSSDSSSSDEETEEERLDRKREEKIAEFIKENGPKKPQSAYIIYSLVKRPEVMAKHPELSGHQVLKKIGPMWKSLSDEEKKEWNERRKEKMIIYKTEMESFESGALKKFCNGPLLQYLERTKEVHSSSEEDSEDNSGDDSDGESDIDALPSSGNDDISFQDKVKRVEEMRKVALRDTQIDFEKQLSSEILPQPTPARTAFQLFTAANVPSGNGITNIHPQQLQDLKDMWNNLSGMEKQEYEAKSKEDARRFEVESTQQKDSVRSYSFKLTQYMEAAKMQIERRFPLPKPPVVESKESRIIRLRKEKLDAFIKENQPKRAPTAYILFSIEKKKELAKSGSNTKGHDLMKVVGALWKQTTEKEREPYEQMASKSRKEREDAMKVFKQGKLQTFINGELADYCNSLERELQ